MSLVTQIEDDLTAALKSNEIARLGVLRLLKNAIKNDQIKLGHELSEAEVIKVLQREAKQRRDSIEAYQKGGREDLAKAEQLELDVIAEYLPPQMDETALQKLVDDVVAETGAKDPAQMGVVIGQVMQRSGGQADGGAVARLVRERLAG